MTYLLLLLMILMLFIILMFNGGDLLFPPAVMYLVYSFSILSAILNSKTWGLELSKQTFFLIISGTFAFFLISILGCLLAGKKRIIKNKTHICHYLPVERYKVIFGVLLCIIISGIYILANINLKGVVGGDSTSAMAEYRYAVAQGKEALPFIIRQVYKVEKIFAYVFTYIFINNFVAVKAKEYVYLIPAFLFAISSLFSGQRSDALYMFLYVLSVSYILTNINSRWKNKIDLKYIVGAIIAVLLFFIFFSVVRRFVGRQNDMDIVSYITFYAGESIKLLDDFVRRPLAGSNVWGKETFVALNKFLSFFDGREVFIRHLEYRFYNGILLGNVYTSLRRYLYDFGFMGMILLQALFGFFYSFWYTKFKNISNYNRSLQFSVIAYCFFSPALYMQSIDDIFFSLFLSVDTVLTLAIMKIFFDFMIAVRIKTIK